MQACTERFTIFFRLRILGEPGDIIRVRLHKKKMLKLKVRKTIGKAYAAQEKERMLDEERRRGRHTSISL